MFLLGSSTAITSNGGDVQVVGQGGNSPGADTYNDGVEVYGEAKELLQLSAVSVNGIAFAGATAPGVHVNAYLGDVFGDGIIGAADVNPMFNVAIGAATGFAPYSLLDPAIVGDVANDVSVVGGDVATHKSYILHFPSGNSDAARADRYR